MFEVLAFVYDHFHANAECPEIGLLERKLGALGFANDEIDDAMDWLRALDDAVHPNPADAWLQAQGTRSMRAYLPHEQAHLGPQALGFLYFLDAAGVLPPHLREVIVERAMAAPGGPVPLDDFKVMVLVVFWRFGREPDQLVLDELCDSAEARTAH